MPLSHNPLEPLTTPFGVFENCGEPVSMEITVRRPELGTEPPESTHRLGLGYTKDHLILCTCWKLPPQTSHPFCRPVGGHHKGMRRHCAACVGHPGERRVCSENHGKERAGGENLLFIVFLCRIPGMSLKEAQEPQEIIGKTFDC